MSIVKRALGLVALLCLTLSARRPFGRTRAFNLLGSGVPTNEGLSRGKMSVSVKAAKLRMTYRIAGFVPISIMFAFATFAAAGTIIRVPANQSTIQAGINAASNGDTVLVAPGTYAENINFNGKAITVASSNGASVTTIAISSGVGVTFTHSETHSSVLKGFTIKGGTNTYGIVIGYSSPTILNNVITGNHACDGAGISVTWASPVIKGNTIAGNFHDSCSGGGGGAGIAVVGPGNTQIIGNVISGNDGGNGSSGGGITLFGAGSTFIVNNIIINNTIQTSGGGIGIEGCCSDAIIVQNLIIGNTAPGLGGGIYSAGNSGAPAIVNNTIASNRSGAAGLGSAVYTNSSPGNPTRLYNNIIFGVSGQTALYCDNFNTTTLPSLFSNDVYARLGTKYGGICTDQTGTNGNISADPVFVSTSNLRPKGGSPAIDAGDNAAPHLPINDLTGNPRIINGNGGTPAKVDIGAYEFVPVVLAPRSLNFGLQAVGSSTRKNVKLTNAQSKVLNIDSYRTPAGYSTSGCGTSVAAFGSCELTVTFHPLTSGASNGVLSIKDNAGGSPQTINLSGTSQ
jgi:hypothetical protein